jgi:hypothetical protein
VQYCKELTETRIVLGHTGRNSFSGAPTICKNFMNILTTIPANWPIEETDLW